MTFFLSDRTTAAVNAPAVAPAPDLEVTHPDRHLHRGDAHLLRAAHPHRPVRNQLRRRAAAAVLPGTDLPLGLRIALACCGLHSSLRIDGWRASDERAERGPVADLDDRSPAVQRDQARGGLVVLGAGGVRDLPRRPRLERMVDPSTLRRLIGRVWRHA